MSFCCSAAFSNPLANMSAISSTLGFVNRDMTRMNFLSTMNVDTDALHAYILENVYLNFPLYVQLNKTTAKLAAL